MSKEATEQICALCERQVSTVSLHHLVPKQHGGKHGPTVPLCQPCHSTIHRTFSNKELARRYHSVDELKKAPDLQKYLEWIRPRSLERISNRRRRR